MDTMFMPRLTAKLSILLVILIFHFDSFDATSIQSKRSYKILEGDNLLVICNTTSENDTDIYWTKNDTKSTFHHDGRRLEILNIKRSFSGDYICHSLNTSYPVPEYNTTDANVTVEVINVDVQYPGEIDQFSVWPYEVIENQTFTISCNFQANPDPVWSIRNRDSGNAYMSATLPADATLTSPPARCEDSGFWECTGKNSLNNGVNVTRGHQVTVYCSPKPQFGKNRYYVRETVGKYAELVMFMRSNPRATYAWSKDDGTDITQFTRHEYSGDEIKLIFPKLTVRSYGNYTLKMQNKYGTYYANYQLITDGSPETPRDLTYFDVSYDRVKLQWSSGYDMGSRQYFIIANYDNSINYHYQFSDRIYDYSSNHGINQSWTYTLNGLSSNTRYNLSVMAENQRGYRSAYSNSSVIFTTIKSPYDDVVSANDSVKLAVGLTFGTLGALALLAIIMYMVKYRRMRTSYIGVDKKRQLF